MLSIRKYIINCFIFCLILYFAFHTIYGKRGAIEYFRLTQELNEQTQKFNNFKNERLGFEHKNSLLRPKSLDNDMLDEMSRKVLNVGNINEKVFKMEEIK